MSRRKQQQQKKRVRWSNERSYVWCLNIQLEKDYENEEEERERERALVIISFHVFLHLSVFCLFVCFLAGSCRLRRESGPVYILHLRENITHKHTLSENSESSSENSKALCIIYAHTHTLFSRTIGW